jgi:DNA-directed RNA polymerase III subunit RPC1
VKRAGSALKIVHDKYSKNNALLVRSQHAAVCLRCLPCPAQETFMTEFDEAVKHNEALRSNLTKVQEDLNPIRVLGLFERISKEDCDLLDIHDRCGVTLRAQSMASRHPCIVS